MENKSLAQIHEQLVLSRRRRIEGGEPPSQDHSLDAVRRGVYVSTGLDLGRMDSYYARICATAEARRPGVVFSGPSAAAMWGVPLMNVHMNDVHLTQPGAHRRRTAQVRVHSDPLDAEEVTAISGLQVTSLWRTLVDLAYSVPLPSSLVPMNEILRRLAHEQGWEDEQLRAYAHELIDDRGRLRGLARAQRNIEAATYKTQFPGEALSLGQMHVIGVPLPQCQTPLPRFDGGGFDYPDFDWAKYDAYGEFDGMGKYLDPEMLDGRKPEEVLEEEKVREGRIRFHRSNGTRWGWRTAQSAHRLATVLANIGIRPSYRRT